MTNKPNLLFLAPDSLPPGLSRAYWLANGLSRHFNVYYVQWDDSRRHRWAKDLKHLDGRIQKIGVSATAFFRSLFTRLRFERKADFGAETLIYTYLPLMLKGSLSHFLGEIAARKIARAFNRFSLERLLRKIFFSAIFHGDGMMLAPILSAEIPSFFDAQDDFDEAREEVRLMEYEKEYFKQNIPLCKANFAINEHTARHFHELSGCKFEVLPNGTDFSLFNQANRLEAENLRKTMGLASKTLVTFIGSAIHFDHLFAENLAKYSLNNHPEIHFLLVGNLPKIDLPNVTNAGYVDPGRVHLFFSLTDIGFMPQSPEDSSIKNCHPLKVIQFSGARKPVITPMLSSFINEEFGNIFPTEYCPREWLQKIVQIKNFRWQKDFSEKWNGFSWQTITDELACRIKR